MISATLSLIFLSRFKHFFRKFLWTEKMTLFTFLAFFMYADDKAADDDDDDDVDDDVNDDDADECC